VPSLKSILPFWRHAVASGEAVPAPPSAKSDDYGKASSFELQIDRMMGEPEGRRDTLFPVGNCR